VVESRLVAFVFSPQANNPIQQACEEEIDGDSTACRLLNQADIELDIEAKL
jgi:hypothetical protein